MMMLALGVGSALLLDAGAPANAAPWCAQYDPYTYNCGFYTFRQCLATISGVGGYCRPNYAAAYEPRVRRKVRY